MGLNTFRNQEERRPSSTYWRRRFFALAGGLAIFALLAWSVSGAIGGVKVISPAANVVTGNQHRQAGSGGPPARPGAAQAPHPSSAPSPRPSAPGGHHTAGHHTAGARPGGKARPAPRKASAWPKPPGGPTGSASPAPGGHGGRPRDCPPGSVVISLFASQASYPARGRPEFDVDVVSTGARTCTFNVGTKYLALVIKAGSSQATRRSSGFGNHQRPLADASLAAAGPGAQLPGYCRPPGPLHVPFDDRRLREPGEPLPDAPGVRLADAADLLQILDAGREQFLQPVEMLGKALDREPGQPRDLGEQAVPVRAHRIVERIGLAEPDAGGHLGDVEQVIRGKSAPVGQC